MCNASLLGHHPHVGHFIHSSDVSWNTCCKASVLLHIPHNFGCNTESVFQSGWHCYDPMSDQRACSVVLCFATRGVGDPPGHWLPPHLQLIRLVSRPLKQPAPGPGLGVCKAEWWFFYFSRWECAHSRLLLGCVNLTVQVGVRHSIFCKYGSVFTFCCIFLNNSVCCNSRNLLKPHQVPFSYESQCEIQAILIKGAVIILEDTDRNHSGLQFGSLKINPILDFYFSF